MPYSQVIKTWIAFEFLEKRKYLVLESRNKKRVRAIMKLYLTSSAKKVAAVRLFNFIFTADFVLVQTNIMYYLLSRNIVTVL